MMLLLLATIACSTNHICSSQILQPACRSNWRCYVLQLTPRPVSTTQIICRPISEPCPRKLVTRYMEYSYVNTPTEINTLQHNIQTNILLTNRSTYDEDQYVMRKTNLFVKFIVNMPAHEIRGVFISKRLPTILWKGLKTSKNVP